MPFKNAHPLYSVWQGMFRRCYDKNCKAWPYYGGRGIKVCDRWSTRGRGQPGFKSFLEDMGTRPSGYSLDRINNDADYCPENCRWATKQEQQRNQRVTRKVTIDGEEYIAVELATKFGLKTDTIVDRAARGMTFLEVTQTERHIFKEGLALGGIASGRVQQSKTHCPSGHLYDGDNLYISKEGWRNCRKCRNERERQRQKRLRSAKC